jgi:hypothetical protein
MTDTTAAALRATLISPNESDQNLEPANVVDGLFAIARAMNRVAESLRKLGLADAATPMGALEAHTKDMSERLSDIAEALRGN